jgi:hypothetical protein
MSDDEDPFEQFEDVSDREGDPFEQFDGVDGGDDDSERSDDTDGGWDSDPFGGDTADASTDATADASAGEGAGEPRYDAHDTTPAGHRDEVPDEGANGVTDPADGRAGTADARDAEGVVEMDEPEIDTGERAGDPFEDEVFEEMDVGELDPDEVWDSIADAEERGSVSQQAERTYAEVSKHRFCEQCEFFSEPPEVACTHEGTEILEFLDQETVRLVDCPVVAERKELEKHE